MEIGYALSSEEFHPNQLVENAKRAEAAGFTFAGISDHFHPWLDSQGHSPFVWSVLGALARETERMRFFTGVTCPLIRTHPAIVAHAAATTAAMMPGRFSLGLGTGEALNEHIFADRWPAAPERREMLQEAVEVIRQLWEGGSQSHRGRHYRLENARLYTLPDEPPPILIAASGPNSAELAARIGDGLITTAPDAEVIEAFRKAGGEGKPVIGQMTVCYDDDEARARKTALEIWANAGVPGQLTQDLPTPSHFEQAAKTVREEDVCGSVVCGPDIDKHLETLQEWQDLGTDQVYLHQIGPGQGPFFEIYEKEVLPRFR
jgi:coenzyme F420-dependent glucose-6-phosphate dehydrogenase